MTLDINRIEMVRKIEARFELHQNIKKAFLEVNRKSFVPVGFGHIAYELDALPIQQNQWISSPLTVAKMTQYLEIEGVDSVLEIGCGSGYQAAILSKLCRRVFTIERIAPLLKRAKERFREAKMNNIFTRFDDGQRGWKEFAPYERILFSATAKQIPQVIFDQLADGGILLAPMQRGEMQVITKYYKQNGIITSSPIEPCRFVPIVDGRVK